MREVKWAFSFIKGKNVILLIVTWLSGLVFTGLLTIEPMIISHIVDDILKPMFADASVKTEEVIAEVVPLLVLALGIIIARAAIKFWANVQRDEVAYRAIVILRKDIYEKVGAQSRNFFMKNRSGDLINKCTGDLDMIRHFIAWVSYNIFECVIMVIVVLTVFFSISWEFTLCLLAISPVAFLTAIRMGKVVRPIFGNARAQLSRLNTMVQENISGNRVVRAFCREEFEIEKFDAENEKYYELQLEGNRVWVKFAPILETVANIMNTCAVIVGALLCIFERITLGDLVIFTSLSWMLNQPMQQLGFFINDLQRFMASCERVHELYDMDTEIKSPEDAVTKEITGEITLKNVTLSYDGDEVLKDINLHIPAGTTVGIMGATGSGKTTLLNVITRFIDVTKGSVLIDGVDVKKYNLQHLRRNIGIALQDVFLFSDTAESNIAYGVPEIDEAEVRKAAVDADADSFVSKLPEGYDTIVGERGMGLSGGQKQRLALARALAMNAPILMLDDTTSAVDLETEKYIRERIAARGKKATKLIVAQRITAVKNADVIIVLENGKITEQGTHKELLEKQGYYYKIYRIQQGLAGEEEMKAALEGGAL
ncbi:MAG: ABC transporter ATP-binding protein [Lachnospiraceae bacterium]|nr:ABC transporter ATP-binding protein [Lachnospiraceae bacterium]